MIKDSPYTDVDFQIALYNDPANEVLLAEFLLQTGQLQQLGLQAAGAGGFGLSSPDPEVTGTNQGPCFAGETLFTLFNGVQIPMAELYDNRREYIGKGARSFTHDNIIVPGEIRDVYKTRVFEVLHVDFQNEPEPMRMRREHRFWTARRRFVSMSDIRRTYRLFTFDDEWAYIRTASRKPVAYPDGIDVYNVLIGKYHAYFATQPGGKPKAVSNAKPIQ